MPRQPRQPRNKPEPEQEVETSAKTPQPSIDPATPTLEPVINDLINIDPDKWFKKSYPLDFGLAHIEIPTVLEDINTAIQLASIHAHDAKKDAEELEGAKMMQLRKDWSITYEDKMTEATVNAVLAQDKQLYAAWHRYAVLKSYVVRFENMMENLRLKMGAMRSFEATRRKVIDDVSR